MVLEGNVEGNKLTRSTLDEDAPTHGPDGCEAAADLINALKQPPSSRFNDPGGGGGAAPTAFWDMTPKNLVLRHC